jgi:hypothetical protein
LDRTKRIGFKPNRNCETDPDQAVSMQTRQAQAELLVFTRSLNKVTIPPKAVLRDFRVGPGHEGLAPHNPDVASFHYEGQVYFNIGQEVVGKTVIVQAGSSNNGAL